MLQLCLGVLVSASVLVFGQESLTITASRSISQQPDEVVFAVNVFSDLNTGLDDVVAALDGSGITAANLSIVSSEISTGPFSQQTILRWTFILPVPFPEIKDTISSLTALQQAIARNESGLSLTFNAQGTQVSPQLQAAQQCPIPDLIADARAQAQKLANGAGATVDQILALSDGSAVAAVSVATVGLFSFAGFLLGGVPPPIPPLNCTIVVKFSVLH